MKSNTAIIIFSRTAHEEALHKHFVKSGNIRANTIIADSLIKHTVDTVKRSKIPYYTIFSNQQEGATFGERLEKALKDVFADGFDNVIAIGNDCPDLDVSGLLKAEKAFATNDIVIGPAKDGGVYLIGLSHQAFTLDALKGIKWESSDTRDSIETVLTAADFSFYCLGLKRDIDTSSDVLDYLLRHVHHHKIDDKIRSVLASVNHTRLRFIFSYISYIKKCRLAFRAPPSTL